VFLFQTSNHFFKCLQYPSAYIPNIWHHKDGFELSAPASRSISRQGTEKAIFELSADTRDIDSLLESSIGSVVLHFVYGGLFAAESARLYFLVTCIVSHVSVGIDGMKELPMPGQPAA
jgi:hypothetical protein